MFARSTKWHRGYPYRLGLVAVALAVVVLPAPAQDGAPTEAERNPSRVALSRDHADDYVGGDQVEISIYIDASQWEGLTAMGLYEQVPAGWTYVGARATGGSMPGVLPQEGASGVLQFVWINQSRAPIQFQYTLKIPASDHGTRTLSGQVEYRLSGGQQTSNVALSQLEGVANKAPEITLLGNASITIPANTAFDDPGAVAFDPEDGEISGDIEIIGTVDTSRPGAYTLTYTVADSVGTSAEAVSRSVRVSASADKADQESPDTVLPIPVPPGVVRDAAVNNPVDPRNAPVKNAEALRINIPDVSLGAARSGQENTAIEGVPDAIEDLPAGHMPRNASGAKKFTGFDTARSGDDVGFATVQPTGNSGARAATWRTPSRSVLALAGLVAAAVAVAIGWRLSFAGGARRRIR